MRITLLVAIVIVLALEVQIFGLLHLHGANLKMWRAQIEVNEEVIKEIEGLRY